jgi:serine protease Do
MLVSSAVILAWLLTGSAWAKMSPRQIYKTMASGVVLIVAAPGGSSSASAGAGSIIRSDGLIVTSCRVIFDERTSKPYEHLFVFLKPDKITGDPKKDLKKRFKAEVVACEKGLDLALIRMTSPPRGLTVIPMGDPGELVPGDETIAIGHPEQGGLWTLTTGIISTFIENHQKVAGKDVIQTDASTNRGNSGGPLFDTRGYQVAVNTSIARKGAGGVAIIGVNFAVMSSVVKRWASKHNIVITYGKEPLVADEPSHQRPPKPEPPPERAEDKETDKAPGEARPPDVRKERPGRKPIRFKKHYRTRRRPYTYHKLFTAVDKIRDQAKRAFDDLENEGTRRRR